MLSLIITAKTYIHNNMTDHGQWVIFKSTPQMTAFSAYGLWNDQTLVVTLTEHNITVHVENRGAQQPSRCAILAALAFSLCHH